jgi:hypothetical protein
MMSIFTLLAGQSRCPALNSWAARQRRPAYLAGQSCRSALISPAARQRRPACL